MSSLIGITTTPDRASDLADIVVARGCQPVLLPCIEVVAHPEDVLDRATDMAENADWLIITSPRTISTLWPEGHMPDVPVAAVGGRTAETVEAAGGTVAVVGDGGAEELLAGLSEDWSGVAIFFPHGAAADSTNFEGTQVVAMAVYDTRPIPPGDAQVDAAVFGSPSAVAGWVMSRDLDDIVLAAIGPTTAEALAERGHLPHIVPDQPGYEVLIDLVAAYLSDRSHV